MVLYTPRLLLVSALASFCANWQFAFQITYVNTSSRLFYNLASRASQNSNGTFPLPKIEWSAQWGTIVSSFYPGSIVGFLLMPVMVARLGVKVSMGILCAFSIAGCACQLLATVPNAGTLLLNIALCGGRFLVGVQAGAALCFLPLYIMEISNPASRSLLSTFQQVSQAFGTLLGLLFGSETLVPLGPYRFEMLQLIAVLPSFLLIFLLTMTPPTPHYLLKEGAEVTKVVKSLEYYQGTTSDLSTLQEDFNMNNTKTTPSGKIPSTSWKGFFIGSVAAMSYSFTADDLIDSFSDHILHNAQGGDITQNLHDPLVDNSADIMSLGLGVILLVSSLGGSFLVDRFGRRPLIILGLFATAIFNVLAAIFLESNPTLVLVFFGLTKAAIGLGAGAPAWFLTSELVALPFVPLLQSLSTGLLLCTSMIATFFYLPLSLISPPLSLIVLSAVPALVLGVILFFFLPETKGKAPREVQLKLASTFLSGCGKKNAVAQETEEEHPKQQYGSI